MRNRSTTSVLVITIGYFLCSPIMAGTIQLGGILSGGAIMQKKVISMREQRYLNLVKQQTEFSCGAATFATILKYGFSRQADEKTVMMGMFKVSDPELVRRKGFSLLDMKRYAKSIGMRGSGFQVKDAKQLQNLQIPVVVLLDIKGYKHFVVLKKATARKAYLADPALGNKVMSLDVFADSWNGLVFAITGKGFNTETILLQPTEPISAKRLMSVHASIPDATQYEFGFGNNKLF